MEVNEFSESILKDISIESGSSSDALKTMEMVYKIYCADNNWKEKYNLSLQ